MRRLSENRALAILQRLKAAYQTRIKREYEHKAEDCRTCPVAGVCCTDAHFVNVHITRLEAVAIKSALENTPRLTEKERQKVYERAEVAINLYGLQSHGETFSQTYSCPLYVKGVGCLVHRRAKPGPCIQHACYENWQDLPPQSLLTNVENKVERLNNETYGQEWEWLPIPVWLSLLTSSKTVELNELLQQWRSRRLRRNERS
jgi:hypothetical protein